MSNDIESTDHTTTSSRPSAGRKRAILIGAGLVAVLALAGTGIAVASEIGDDDSAETLTGTSLEQARSAALAETGDGEVVDAEQEGTGYEVEVRLADGSEIDVYLDDNFDVTRTENDDSTDKNTLTGSELERATAAALAETGDGEVTDADAEGTGFEVEVRLADGSEVDVHFDESYEVTGTDVTDDDTDND